jgi:hypothetical protein
MTRKKRRTVTSPSRHPVLRSLRAVPTLVLAILALSLPGILGVSHAQSNPHEKPYALIFGTVWGPDNRPVYGIKIKIRRSTDSKAKWQVFSDHSGEFAQRVPAGKQDYVLWADLKGVKPVSGKSLQAHEVNVHIDNDERADIGVHLTE